MILDMSYNNKRRPYEVAPIPFTGNPLNLNAGGPQARGKGISVTISLAIPFAQIYTILKQMYEAKQATPEDLQQAAEELRKVADLIEDLATSIP